MNLNDICDLENKLPIVSDFISDDRNSNAGIHCKIFEIEVE